MKRWQRAVAGMLACLGLLVSAGAAEEREPEAYPARAYAFTGKVRRTYDSDSLIYTVESFRMDGVLCILSKIWVLDPEKQIHKATSTWKKNLRTPEALAKQVPGAALVINGSGYVSPTYPEIPDSYPGISKDYYYTPLGSLTVTDGEVLRNLEGVPYSGLTLEADGLRMYTGEENEAVLARNPSQTWSFYEQCPMIRQGEVLTPGDWTFAGRNARRTVIARMDRNNYLILTVTNDGGAGLSLYRVNEFFLEQFDAEWVYNLDGGPSSALLCRKKGKKTLVAAWKAGQKIVDIMAFTELLEENN